jgi:nucleoside 2-deoxyribosyltransferase
VNDENRSGRPDGLLPDPIEIGRRKSRICAFHGINGALPLDNVIDLRAADASLNIFKGNEAMMDAADVIIANLTPFRGSGAVAEQRTAMPAKG